MKKARFEELLSSVKQATEIARGARAPSRTLLLRAIRNDPEHVIGALSRAA